MKIDFVRAIAGGVFGTVVMTVVGVYVVPMMGLVPMNPVNMLAGQMGQNMMLGWGGHFMIGTVLAVMYAGVGSHIPGPGPVRGAMFSLAPWLMAQVALIPMMGMPLFSGDAMMAMGSLIGHMVFGAVMGAVYGEAGKAVRAAA